MDLFASELDRLLCMHASSHQEDEAPIRKEMADMQQASNKAATVFDLDE